MHGGAVRVRGSESSQFVSALLLTLPTVSPDSVVRVVGGLVRNLTLRRRWQCSEQVGSG